MSYENVKNSRERLKLRVVRALGSKCAICGYDKCVQALEAHHIDPNQKEFSISTNANKAYDLISEELKKCVLLCANCHREYHAGLFDIELISSFDEQVDLEIKRELEVIKHGNGTEIKRCTQCGTIITGEGKTQLCPQCYQKTTRRTEWPEREELKDLIRNLPFTTIAKQYGVTDNAVRKWCDKYDLPRTKSEIKQYSDEQWATV